MRLSRRTFTGGLLALPLVGITRPAAAQLPATPVLAAALAAIRGYAEAHRSRFGLSALTVGLTSSSGASVINSGLADPVTRRPVTDETLFQIGSISKVMTAALIHQFAQEGRLRLDSGIARLMPDLPLPKSSTIAVQHLLDHVSGLPGDAGLFPPDGLWLGFTPGTHWHYSNTGYTILGKLAEQLGGKPLSRLLRERLFAPLGMTRSRGAITATDRALYAQGFEGGHRAVAAVPQTPRFPAAWVDTSFGAGSVGSTAGDMILFMRSLAAAARGDGGLGLRPQQGRAFTSHFVAPNAGENAYGNGLRHLRNGEQHYLHHTGGMVSFSSSFHLDPVSGIGAFAGTPLGFAAGYRPRALTLFAVKALAAAEAGQPLPDPPPLDEPVKRIDDYLGVYWQRGREVEIKRNGQRLALVADGREVMLHPRDGDSFNTLHPAFADHGLWFERSNGRVVALHSGGQTFSKAGSGFVLPNSDSELQRLAGRFVNDSPWIGLFHVHERGGKLWFATGTPTTRLGPNLWRVAEEEWSPERLWFGDFLNGRPQAMYFSGDKFIRQDV